jgi:hypothetical protein
MFKSSYGQPATGHKDLNYPECFNGSHTTLAQHSALEIAAGASKDKGAIFHLPGPVFS